MSNVLGEIAEQKFTVKAIQNGFKVSRPIGHATAYDFIIEKEGRLFRIQVKSCFSGAKFENSYKIGISKSGKVYDKFEFDYYAIYIDELNSFFLIPFNETPGITLRVHEDPAKSKYTKYRNNWDI